MKEEFGLREFSCELVDRLLYARTRSTKSHEAARKDHLQNQLGDLLAAPTKRRPLHRSSDSNQVSSRSSSCVLVPHSPDGRELRFLRGGAFRPAPYSSD